jgi:hypothetical protein
MKLQNTLHLPLKDDKQPQTAIKSGLTSNFSPSEEENSEKYRKILNAGSIAVKLADYVIDDSLTPAKSNLVMKAREYLYRLLAYKSLKLILSITLILLIITAGTVFALYKAHSIEHINHSQTLKKTVSKSTVTKKPSKQNKPTQSKSVAVTTPNTTKSTPKVIASKPKTGSSTPVITQHPTSSSNTVSTSSPPSNNNNSNPLPQGPTVNQSISLSTAGENSNSWAGYQLLNGSTNEYSMVEATIVVPTITCTSSLQTDRGNVSAWVGLGQDLLAQEGLNLICWGPGNQNNYTIWTEEYPYEPGAITHSSVTISPGDTLFMQVTYLPSSNQYEFYMHDETLGNGPNSIFSEYESCPSGYTCDNSTADWIAEAPSNSYSTPYGSITFQNTLVQTSSYSSPNPFTDFKNSPWFLYENGNPSIIIDNPTYPLNEGVSSFTIQQL